MPLECNRVTTGGKGNRGHFIERDPYVCAAGVPSFEADKSITEAFDQYTLQDEVESLIHDAIVPPPKPRPLLPLRHPIPRDMRNAGPFGDVRQLINPPVETKFQLLVNDLKNTNYTSYWKKNVGQVPDPVPMFPAGFKKDEVTFGKKLKTDITLYDLVMPKDPISGQTPVSKLPAVQTDRKYCKPPFNPDLTFGHRYHTADKRGYYAKCALTNDRIVIGTGNRIAVNSRLTDFIDFTTPTLGKPLTPNDNIACVPEGHAFGKPSHHDEKFTLSSCKLNPETDFFRQCLGHLNSLRKIMSKMFHPTFFRTFYLNYKYFDKGKTGWLPKTIIYDQCGQNHIRFDPKLIEHLLRLWGAFDGECIEYKTFVQMLNFKQRVPDLPKISELPIECLDYRTTYGEMCKEGIAEVKDTSLRAGLPAARYFDLDYPRISNEKFCAAHKICLSEESDVKSCIAPSILTQLNVSHRDMYAQREPHVVRRVFEACEKEKFTDERFNAIWEEAKKYHSKGWVCYETFRKALQKLS